MVSIQDFAQMFTNGMLFVLETLNRNSNMWFLQPWRRNITLPTSGVSSCPVFLVCVSALISRDIIILRAKFHIFKSKLQKGKPNVNIFIHSLKQRAVIEKYCIAASDQEERHETQQLSLADLLHLKYVSLSLSPPPPHPHQPLKLYVCVCVCVNYINYLFNM